MNDPGTDLDDDTEFSDNIFDTTDGDVEGGEAGSSDDNESSDEELQGILIN